MEKILKIGDLSAEKGQKISGEYKVAGTDLTVPVTLINGVGEGKVFLLTAGVHPDEYPGIQAALELKEELQPEQINGAVVIVPMLNYSGTVQKFGYKLPADGKNMNKVFPGSPDGSPAEKLAWAIHTDFHGVCDYNIDLHSGGEEEDMEPLIFFSMIGGEEQEKISHAMAAQTGVTYLVRSSSTNGEYGAASTKGLPSFLLERGGQGYYSAKEKDENKRDVLAVMKYLGIYNGEVAPAEKTPVDAWPAVYLEADFDGRWFFNFTHGDKVREGEVLGVIKNWMDDTVLAEYKAPFDGVVLYHTTSLSIKKGGALVAYGKLDW